MELSYPGNHLTGKSMSIKSLSQDRHFFKVKLSNSPKYIGYHMLICPETRMYKCTRFLALVLCLIVKEEYNISETESIMFSGWKVVQWLRIALYVRSSSVCASMPHTWGQQYTVYEMLCYIQNTRQWTESRNRSPVPTFSFLEIFQPKLCTNFLYPLVQIFHSSFFCSSRLQSMK